MRTLNRFLSLLLFCSFGCAFASAQAPHKTLLVVSCSCDDTIGKSYLSALRTAIGRNTHYREVGTEEGMRKNAVQLSIVSMSLPGSEGVEKSVLSIVCVHDGVILHQMVETCSHIPVEQTAEAMLQDLTTWDAAT